MDSKDFVGRSASRRAALGLGVGVAASAMSLFSASSADAADVTIAQVADALGLCVVTQYGAVSGQDSTAAIVDAINDAAAKKRAVYFPPGIWMVSTGIVVPDGVHLIGSAPSTSRFGSQLDALTFCRIVPVQSTFAGNLITLAGAGSGISNISLVGNWCPGTLLVTQGFETTLHSVRIFKNKGIGLDVQRANNTRWDELYIDNCGSATLPAVKVWSKTGLGTGETNTLDISGLTIERSANMALDLAWGNTGEDYAEFIRIERLHVEAGTDANANTSPLVRIGNVRSLCFTDPFIYGGPAPLIEHADQGVRASNMKGGIRVLGGTLLGGDPKVASRVSTNLVRLTSGNDFGLVGTRLMRYTEEALTVASSYGANVELDNTTYSTGPVISDNRTQRWVPDGAAATAYSARNDAAITIANTTPAEIASTTLDCPRNGTVTITISLDLDYTTANDTLVANAYIDAPTYQISGSAVYRSGAAGRVPVSRTWSSPIPAGAHTVSVKALRHSGTGTHQVLALSSLLVVYQPL